MVGSNLDHPAAYEAKEDRMTLHLTSCVYEDQPHPVDLRDLARRLRDGGSVLGDFYAREGGYSFDDDVELISVSDDARGKELAIWALERCAGL
jgi:hypothetical protein